MFFIAIGSILALALVAWWGNRATGFSICPICAGVSLTWAWMLALKALGFASDNNVIALLLGGSAVGIAYVLEKRLRPNYSPVLWKTLAIALGLSAGYGLLTFSWLHFAASAAGLALLSYFFLEVPWFRSKHGDDRDRLSRVRRIEKSMKDCC